MRKLLLASTVVLAALAHITIQPAAAAEPAPRLQLAANSHQAPLGERLRRLVHPRGSYQTAFCGQCTKNDDCGVGYVCRNTAPVNSGKVCNECVKK